MGIRTSEVNGNGQQPQEPPEIPGWLLRATERRLGQLELQIVMQNAQIEGLEAEITRLIGLLNEKGVMLDPAIPAEQPSRA